MLPKHPEWLDAFKIVIEPHFAGLPQDGNVFWVSLTVPQIRKGMAAAGCDISEYHVRQILE
ncbi:rhodopirellula transposase, partial [gut metagenome]